MQLISRLENWSRREFARLESVFAERKNAGFIRECHGDMHLGNMVLLGDRVTIFDCIEFNEDLRWIDVMSEAAFVVMDLYDRGRSDLARRFQNAYLEITGDFGGLLVLPFYLAYRALVRAKVALLRINQAGLSEGDLARQEDAFQGYLDLAEQFTQPRQPALLITCGLSGSGKSTAAQKLVEELGAVCIHSDVERKRLLGLGRFQTTRSAVGRDAYSEQTTEMTYARLAQLAELIITAGESVIVDATFLSRGRRDEFRRLAEKLAVPYVLLAFGAPDETLKRRIQQRAQEGRVVSEADLAVFEQQRQSFEPLDKQELSAVVPVDVSQANWLDALTDRIKPRLQK